MKKLVLYKRRAKGALLDNVWTFSISFHQSSIFPNYKKKKSWYMFSLNMCLFGWYWGYSTKRVTILNIDFTWGMHYETQTTKKTKKVSSLEKSRNNKDKP